jgi:chemotaxis protein methyltransferase CheR
MSDRPQPISADAYRFLRALLREQIGYELGDAKEYLAEARLNPIAASFGLAQVNELLDQLRRTGRPALREAVVEAMTINETYFFRSPRVFEDLRNRIIPELIAARSMSRSLRFWCAACSTGQEPYSIAMTLADHFPELGQWNVDIMASDVSQRALDHARRGAYNQFDVQRGLPIQSLVKHFRKTADHWQIADSLRRLVQFRQLNLVDASLGVAGPFDVVLLRNVLLYFDRTLVPSIFTKLRRLMASDGYLVLGESETILGVTTEFSLNPHAADFYRPA